MANELFTDNGLVGTKYAHIETLTGTIWNGTADVSYVSGDIANYDVPLTRRGSTTGYYGTMPAGVPVGVRRVKYYSQIGGSPSEFDEMVWQEFVSWGNGTISPIETISQTIVYSPVEQNPRTAWVVIPKGSGLPIKFNPEIEMAVDPQYLKVNIGIIGDTPESFTVALSNMEVDSVTGIFKIFPAISWTNSLNPDDDRIVGDVLRTGPTDRNKGLLKRLRVQVMPTL